MWRCTDERAGVERKREEGGTAPSADHENMEMDPLVCGIERKREGPGSRIAPADQQQSSTLHMSSEVCIFLSIALRATCTLNSSQHGQVLQIPDPIERMAAWQKPLKSFRSAHAYTGAGERERKRERERPERRASGGRVRCEVAERSGGAIESSNARRVTAVRRASI
jgi:hypothetical protein